MKRAAIIEDGVIINFTSTDSLEHPDGLDMVYTDGQQIGDSWNGSVFSTSEEFQAVLDSAAAAVARETRNNLLAATDFYALSDVTMSDDMETYRAALRAVPAQDGFPNTITWPEAP